MYIYICIYIYIYMGFQIRFPIETHIESLVLGYSHQIFPYKPQDFEGFPSDTQFSNEKVTAQFNWPPEC